MVLSTNCFSFEHFTTLLFRRSLGSLALKNFCSSVTHLPHLWSGRTVNRPPIKKKKLNQRDGEVTVISSLSASDHNGRNKSEGLSQKLSKLAIIKSRVYRMAIKKGKRKEKSRNQENKKENFRVNFRNSKIPLNFSFICIRKSISPTSA